MPKQKKEPPVLIPADFFLETKATSLQLSESFGKFSPVIKRRILGRKI